MGDKTKRPFDVITGGKDSKRNANARPIKTDVAANTTNTDITIDGNDAGDDTTNIAQSIDDTASSIDRTTDGSGKRKRKLTGKQLKFARLLMEGELSQSECYRRVYNATRMADNTVWRESSLLASHPMVTTMLKQQKQRLVDATISQAMRRQAHVLTGLHTESINEQSPAAARIRALELLGRVALDGPALFSERVEVSNTDSESASQVREELEARLQKLLAHHKSS